ncbi:hypothetical protein JL721_8527 [Aureococcus anophagefferens]|nr:hypothetical protein JL722_11789 [Aureococcus anophagefferens]KAH8063953.1 hypothetical protein JL721_8527 [Aureococcus anophagefferens]
MFEQLSQELRGATQVKPTLPTEEGDATEITYPDLMTEANVYEWAGINFGKMETYRLYLAIKQKAVVEARSLRFWGKITGRSGDYFVVQGGTEAHLLRAQIAMITSECSISPGGFYAEDDEAEEGIKAIKKVEEMDDFKSAEDLKDASNWVHHEVPINVNGRCNQPPANEEEEDGAEPSDELPDLPLLGAIAEDEITDGPAWSISVCPGGTGESPDSVVIAKSLKWPGAVAAAFGNKFINVYGGFGFASSRGVSYEPPRVPPIQKEWAPTEEDDKGLIEDEDKITQPVVEEEEEEDG